MTVQITTTPYGGWQNCITLSNGLIEAVVTADVGPRVIRLGFPGGANAFYESPEQLGRVGDSHWNIYGGHRLWHSPEDRVRTYTPDNAPVTVETFAGGARFIQPLEVANGIQKQITLTMTEGQPHIRVVHQMTNTGAWAIPFASWALSVMAANGACIFPLPARGSHETDLLAGNTLSLWTYTLMNDPRWTWGSKYITLRQVPGAIPQKIGASVPDGWAGYLRDDLLFVKLFDYDAGAPYPDGGCNFETFTNDVMIEVETLGALRTVQPGETVEHVEEWCLFPGAAVTQEADIDSKVLPYVQTAKALATKNNGV